MTAKKRNPREPFQVRMTEDEKALIDKAAEVQSLSVSTWMRVTCLEAAREILSDAKRRKLAAV